MSNTAGEWKKIALLTSQRECVTKSERLVFPWTIFKIFTKIKVILRLAQNQASDDWSKKNINNMQRR